MVGGTPRININNNLNFKNMPILKINGARSVKSKSGKNIYVRAEINGKAERCFFPNDLGVGAKELIVGSIDVAEQEYTRQEDDAEKGWKKGDTFKRWDVMNYKSVADQKEVLVLNADLKGASKKLQVEHKLTDAEISAMIS